MGSAWAAVYYNKFSAADANIVDYENTTIGFPSLQRLPGQREQPSRLQPGLREQQALPAQPLLQVDEFWKVYQANLDGDNRMVFNTVDVTAGWTRSTLNKGQFPTAGDRQRVNAKVTVPGMDLQYFKLNAEDSPLLPVSMRDHQWVMLAKACASYGNGYGSNGDDHVLPFFENYYAGGFDTLRAASETSNTVGPKALYYYNLGGNDVIQGTDSSVGGNALAVASSR